MNLLTLPDPEPAAPPPFRDAAGARAWLASQPQAQPREMLAVLHKTLAGIDAAGLPPAVRLDILDALRGAVILAQSAAEARFSRKPLPLPDADAELFYAARKLWRILAIAYLRTVPALPAAEALRPLHRGAVTLRLEQYAHYLAAYAVPSELWQHLRDILATATGLGLQLVPLVDPEYKHLGKAHIAGQVAWAGLLHLADPYRLSLAQLAVANRAFSRWRELASFQSERDEDPRARQLPLAQIFGPRAIEGDGLRWLDVRPVARKFRKRIEALEAGETPEALKLGRELSAAACIRLLRLLGDSLGPEAPAESGETGDLELVFEAENIFTLLTGERLRDEPPADQARVVDHRRLALFGFDHQVAPSPQPSPAVMPKEAWRTTAGCVVRAPAAGGRVLVPCLVAQPKGAGREVKLGLLTAAHIAADGKLRGRLQWFEPPLQAASAKVSGAGGKTVRIPVFALGKDEESVILPASAAFRPDSRLVLEGAPPVPVVLGDILERGSDFIRYAVRS